jgi:hypothetical protein
MLQEGWDNNGNYKVLFGYWYNNHIWLNGSLVRLQIPFHEAEATVYNTLAGENRAKTISMRR